MTFTEIRNTVISRMTAQTIIDGKDGIIIIQLFVPAGSGSKLITETADKLRELFEFQDDDRLSYQAVSSIAVGEKNGWFQLNLQIPYRAL